MFSQKRPRIEWTHYIGGAAPVEPVAPVEVAEPVERDGTAPISELRLDPLTVKVLDTAAVITVADVADLVFKAADPEFVMPKGIGKRRVKEIEAAIEAYRESVAPAEPTEPMAPSEPIWGPSVADLIFAAGYVVARRCGAGALYHSGEIVQQNGRQVLVMQWSAGSNWQALVRAVRHDDKHFHKCPLRRAVDTGEIEVLED